MVAGGGELAWPRSGDGHRVFLRSSGHGKPEREPGAWTVLGLQGEVAPHPPSQLAADGQAEAEPGPAASLPTPHEALKDQLPFLGRDTRAPVADAEDGLVPVAQLDPDLPTPSG